MYLSIKKVVPCDDFTLSIDFENGEHGTLDMKPFLDFGVFNRLKVPGAFEQVKIAFDTIEWDCGVDLDPEFVYAKTEGINTAQPVG